MQYFNHSPTPSLLSPWGNPKVRFCFLAWLHMWNANANTRDVHTCQANTRSSTCRQVCNLPVHSVRKCSSFCSFLLFFLCFHFAFLFRHQASSNVNTIQVERNDSFIYSTFSCACICVCQHLLLFVVALVSVLLSPV